MSQKQKTKPNSGKITPHFTWQEANCRDGTIVPQHLQKNTVTLCKNLEVLRAFIGNKPIHVNDIFRTPQHNEEVKGSPRSQHLFAKAADIWVAYVTPKELNHTIKFLIDQGEMLEGGLGLYNWGVHYDIRGTKARWNMQHSG